MRPELAFLAFPIILFCGSLSAQEYECLWNGDAEKQVFSMVPNIISQDDVLQIWEFELSDKPKAYYITKARGVCALGVKDASRDSMMLIIYYEPTEMIYVDHVGIVTSN